MEKHHWVARSRGGTDDDWNLGDLSEYEHAYEHALNFVLFENAPAFHFCMKGWKELPKDLQQAVKRERGRRTALNNKSDFMRNLDRKAVSTVEIRQKQRIGQLNSWSVDLARADKTSAQMRETNLLKKPCPKCGLPQNAGNLRRHMQGKRCQTLRVTHEPQGLSPSLQN